jgi:hypothetical protein
MRIIDFIKKGFSCPKCSDKIPYAEKFIFNVLEQLNIIFKTQLSRTTFNWCNDYRYDFYLRDLNCIIETHGLQHYEESFKRISKKAKCLEEIQDNDKIKEQLAKQNNINNYIVIDCRKSEMEWIKNNIMQSNLSLPQLLNFKESDIDWIKCHEFACNSFVKTTCDLWNNEVKIAEIAEILKVHRNTIRRYLKQGTGLKWCYYDSNENTKNNLISMHERKCKQVICLTTGKIFNSIKEAGKEYNIKQCGIGACCSNNQKYAGKHPETGENLRWMYYEDYIKEQNGKE